VAIQITGQELLYQMKTNEDALALGLQIEGWGMS